MEKSRRGVGLEGCGEKRIWRTKRSERTRRGRIIRGEQWGEQNAMNRIRGERKETEIY